MAKLKAATRALLRMGKANSAHKKTAWGRQWRRDTAEVAKQRRQNLKPRVHRAYVLKRLRSGKGNPHSMVLTATPDHWGFNNR